MIAKVTSGSSGRGLIRYLFGPGQANEHTDQRVITSGIVMGVEEGRGLSPAEIAELGAGWKPAIPQEVTDFFERRVLREIVNVVPAIRQHPAIAVEIADRRRRGDRVFEPRLGLRGSRTAHDN